LWVLGNKNCPWLYLGVKVRTVKDLYTKHWMKKGEKGEHKKRMMRRIKKVQGKKERQKKDRKGI
jgi:hypothetical protein